MGEQAFGMSSRREAVWGTHGAPLQVCEERVFNVGEAPLLLAVMPSWQSMQHMQESDEEDTNVEHEDKESRKNSKQTKVTWRRTPGHSTSWTKHVSEVAPCFELQRSEANSLVKRVLWTIQNRTMLEHVSSPSHGPVCRPSVCVV